MARVGFTFRLLAAAAFVAAVAFAQRTSTSSLSLSIGAACEVTGVSFTSLPAAEPGTLAGTVAFTYRLRTGKTGGFARLVLVPETASAATVEFRASVPGGAGLSGSAVLTGELTVATFGANARTTATGDRGSVQWTVRGAVDPGLRLTPRITCQ